MNGLSMRLTTGCCVSLVAVSLLAGGCVDDPFIADLGSGDLRPSDDAGAPDLRPPDAGPPPTLDWVPRRAGITGIRAHSMVTSNTAFFVGADDGIYTLHADGTLDTGILAPPTEVYALVGVDNERPIVSTISELQRTAMIASWVPVGSGLAGHLPMQLVKTAARYFAWVPALGIYRSTSIADDTTFSLYIADLTIFGIAERSASTIYLAKGNLGLAWLNDAAVNEVDVTGVAPLKVRTVTAGALTLAGGNNGTDAQVIRIDSDTASSCGNALVGEDDVLALASTTDLNIAVTSSHAVYTNIACAPAWTWIGTFDGDLRGLGVTMDGFDHVIAVATSTTLFYWSEATNAMVEVPVGSASVSVTSIAVNPANSDHLVVGTDGRGVWESRNRGQSWLRLEATLFNSDLATRVLFSAPNTLIVAGDFAAEGTPHGGVFRGTFANDVWTFSRVGGVGAGEPPRSTKLVEPSSTFGLLACFESTTQPLWIATGADWQAMPQIDTDLDCTAIGAADDGTLHWIGGTGVVNVIHGSDPEAVTFEQLDLPNIASVSRIVALDAKNRALVATEEGAFILDGSTFTEVRYGGLGLGEVTAVYREPSENGRRRVWLASTLEPLLLSDDDGVTWQRVPATAAGHIEAIAGLLRVEDDLFAVSWTSSVWRAPLQ